MNIFRDFLGGQIDLAECARDVDMWIKLPLDTAS